MGEALTIPQAIWSKQTLQHKSLRESCLQFLKKTKLQKVTEVTTQGRLVTVFCVRAQGMKSDIVSV